MKSVPGVGGGTLLMWRHTQRAEAVHPVPCRSKHALAIQLLQLIFGHMSAFVAVGALARQRMNVPFEFII